jgi:hypothetical protein
MRPLLIIPAVVLAVLHPLLALAAVLAACGVLSALIARTDGIRPCPLFWRTA